MAYDARHNRFVRASSEKKGFFASLGGNPKRTALGSSASARRWRGAGEVYALPLRWAPSGGPKRPGLLSRLLGALGPSPSSRGMGVPRPGSRNVKVEPTAAFRPVSRETVPAFRAPRVASPPPRPTSSPSGGTPWFRRNAGAPPPQVRFGASSMNAGNPANASSGLFYRPGSAERGAWASSSKGGAAGARDWKPRAFLSAKARWMALKMAALAALVAVAVAMHGRVVESLQDLAGLKLSQVKVSGTKYLTPEEVVAVAGLVPGEGMFRLDLGRAAQAVQALPWVARARFERRLPRHVLIAVEERVPAALVDAGEVWGVDAAGRLLPPAQGLLNEDLPLLSGVALQPRDAGNTRVAETLKPALDFLAFLRKQDPALYADVSEVNAQRSDALRVTFLDGTVARFDSSAGEVELRRMAAVLSDLAAKHRLAALMDFRFKDQVVVRLR